MSKNIACLNSEKDLIVITALKIDTYTKKN